MRKLSDLQPMNSNERFLYELIIRQNIIIEQLSSIVEHISKKDGATVEQGLVQTEPNPVDVAVETPVTKPKARRTRKKVE